jgi:hypothetical protein
MHVQRDQEKRVLSIVRRHIYDFIRSMGLDLFSSASVSTPLDPNLLFRKADCSPVIDAEIKERVLRYPRASTPRFSGFRLGRRPGQLPQHWRLHLLLGRRSLLMEGQTQQHCAPKFSRKRGRCEI